VIDSLRAAAISISNRENPSGNSASASVSSEKAVEFDVEPVAGGSAAGAWSLKPRPPHPARARRNATAIVAEALRDTSFSRCHWVMKLLMLHAAIATTDASLIVPQSGAGPKTEGLLKSSIDDMSFETC
jgi:hypothetical protein